MSLGSCQRLREVNLTQLLAVAVGVFAEQVVGDFEDIAADRQHCSSVP